MDINTGTLGYAPLGFSKQEQRTKLGLYFKCGSSSYLSNYYSAPMPQRELRTANISSCLLHWSSSYCPQSLPSSSPVSSKHHL